MFLHSRKKKRSNYIPTQEFKEDRLQIMVEHFRIDLFKYELL